jgi:hypothetical protein
MILTKECPSFIKHFKNYKPSKTISNKLNKVTTELVFGEIFLMKVTESFRKAEEYCFSCVMQCLSFPSES